MPTAHTMRISTLWANGFVDILFAILSFFFEGLLVAVYTSFSFALNRKTWLFPEYSNDLVLISG